MTAGIIAGDGSVAGASGAKDSAGYYNGSGIAPGASIFVYAITTFLETCSASVRLLITAETAWNLI